MADLSDAGGADAEDILETCLDAFLAWEVYTANTCHCRCSFRLALALLVLGVVANHAHASVAADDLALLANLLD